MLILVQFPINVNFILSGHSSNPYQCALNLFDILFHVNFWRLIDIPGIPGIEQILGKYPGNAGNRVDSRNIFREFRELEPPIPPPTHTTPIRHTSPYCNNFNKQKCIST